MHNLLYVLIFGLLSIGMFGVFTIKNKIKKLIFLGLMQTSVIMLYVSAAYKKGNFIEPVYATVVTEYINPVPHVLMLTAIVVGVAVSSVGLAMVIQIKKYK